MRKRPPDSSSDLFSAGLHQKRLVALHHSLCEVVICRPPCERFGAERPKQEPVGAMSPGASTIAPVDGCPLRGPSFALPVREKEAHVHSIREDTLREGEGVRPNRRIDPQRT
jgi:hypothetical protein